MYNLSWPKYYKYWDFSQHFPRREPWMALRHAHLIFCSFEKYGSGPRRAYTEVLSWVFNSQWNNGFKRCCYATGESRNPQEMKIGDEKVSDILLSVLRVGSAQKPIPCWTKWQGEVDSWGAMLGLAFFSDDEWHNTMAKSWYMKFPWISGYHFFLVLRSMHGMKSSEICHHAVLGFPFSFCLQLVASEQPSNLVLYWVRRVHDLLLFHD